MTHITPATEKGTGKENVVNQEIETEKESSTASASEKCGTGIANEIKTETETAQLITGTPNVLKWTVGIVNVAFLIEEVEESVVSEIVGIGTETGWIVTIE